MWYSIIFIAGVILLVVSLYLLDSRIRFLKSGSMATGTVIAIEEGRDSDGDRTNKPVFSFRTHANREITFTYQVSTNPPAWEVGDTWY